VPFLAGCDITYVRDFPDAGQLLEATVTAVVWAVANVVYFEQKRRGIQSGSRFIAFWLGNPATWVTFFMLSEGSHAELKAPPDDEAELFREVRKDRSLRAVRGDPTAPHTD
jgi:hypothetical protein